MRNFYIFNINLYGSNNNYRIYNILIIGILYKKIY